MGELKNVPLTHSEIKRLPLGFTPTSFGLTGQQLKKLNRMTFDRTNRKVTKARRVQYIPIWARGDSGDPMLDKNDNKIIAKYKTIWHKSKEEK